MTETAVILLLVIYIIAREIFFLYSTHKFINKIMSHNFHDYQQSLKLDKPKQPTIQRTEFDDLPEDLGSLEGLGIL